VLKRHAPGFDAYSFLERGSDERQYCSPLVDLPVVSVMRSKYGTYREYHTSLDDLSLVTQAGLEGSLAMMQRCILAIEANRTYVAAQPCEPQLGPRGLYPTVSTRDSGRSVRSMMNLLAYADGATDLIGIAELIGEDIADCAGVAQRLEEAGVLVRT